MAGEPGAENLVLANWSEDYPDISAPTMRTIARILPFTFFLGWLASAYAQTPVLDRDFRRVLTDLSPVAGTMPIEPAALDGRPVIVTFFASWCPPCLEEFAHLNHLQQKYRDTDLAVVAINVYEAWDDNDEARMKRFIERTRPAFPALVGSEPIRSLFGGISRIPTVYGFNRDGELTYEFIHRRGAPKTNATFSELDDAASLLLDVNR